MKFVFDKSKIQGPAPGTFEANILRSITVPFQEIDTSGGQYPLPVHPTFPAQRGPAIVIKLEGLTQLLSFPKGLAPLELKNE